MPMMKETMLKRLLLPIAAAGGGGSAPVEDTATGNPLTFITDVRKPLKSLLIPFTPQQQGSGNPSPQNIRSILPWNGLTVWNGGKNLLDPSALEQGGIDIDGSDTSVRFRIRTGYIPAKENTVYAISAGAGHKLFMHFYDANKGSLGANVSSKSISPPGACYVRGIIGYADDSSIDPSELTDGQIEALENSSATATAYEPYHPITDTDIVFPSAVYGGTLDVVSGVLTVEWVCYDLSDLTWEEYTTNRVRTSYLMDKPVIYPETPNDYPDVIAEEYIPLKQSGSLASNHNGIIIMPRSSETAGRILMYFDGENYPSGKACFKLATPQAVTLTPTKITAIVGDNTIWTDADGEMTSTYLKKA